MSELDDEECIFIMKSEEREERPFERWALEDGIQQTGGADIARHFWKLAEDEDDTAALFECFFLNVFSSFNVSSSFCS